MVDLGEYVRGRAPGSRWGRLAVVAYAVASVGSVAWGLSGGTAPDNPLAAQARWDATEFPTLVVTNLSDEDWTRVRAELDRRYYVELARVPRGQSVAVSASEFRDGYVLPRPDGMFGYERTMRRAPEPERALPPGYAPAEVRVVAEQGAAVARLAAP
jgi:hypothetical protein